MNVALPPVKNLAEIAKGTSADARLVAALLLHALDADTDGSRPLPPGPDGTSPLQRALVSLADACGSSPWTVYHWLRGTRTPSGAGAKLLRLTAHDVGVLPLDVPANADTPAA